MRLPLTLRTLRCAPQYVSSRPESLGRRSYASKVSKPLRILFCGSDDFSCESLQALHVEQQRDSQSIKSIDVLCRPGKKSGRSMKHVREVPIKAVAQKLGLTVHERDTFTGWQLPRPQNESVNLIIAVSFGLFVPPRILKSAEYGGLNVHPSLLPNFRGPAPLQHTILAREDKTGVTLQTLDEKSFDHGTILAQSPPPGLDIPSPDTCTYNDLLEFIKPKAAALLVQGIRSRVFVPPLVDVGQFKAENIQHAPKVTPQNRMILWDEWDAETIYARHRALGRLWTTLSHGDNKDTRKRIIFEDFEVLETPWIPDLEFLSPIFLPKYKGDGVYKFDYYVRNSEGPVHIFCKEQKTLKVREITIEGGGKKRAIRAMKELGIAPLISLDWDEGLARNTIKWTRELARTGEVK